MNEQELIMYLSQREYLITVDEFLYIINTSSKIIRSFKMGKEGNPGYFLIDPNYDKIKFVIAWTAPTGNARETENQK